MFKKLNKTVDLIGCSQSFFKKWILYQLYGDMTEEIYGCVRTFDPCYLLSKANVSNEMIKLKLLIGLIQGLCILTRKIQKVIKMIITYIYNKR